jgi:hypothetical protein
VEIPDLPSTPSAESASTTTASVSFSSITENYSLMGLSHENSDPDLS